MSSCHPSYTPSVKVLTFLTMPVDPTSADVPRQLESQRVIKALFLKQEAVAVGTLHAALNHLCSCMPDHNQYRLKFPSSWSNISPLA